MLVELCNSFIRCRRDCIEKMKSRHRRSSRLFWSGYACICGITQERAIKSERELSSEKWNFHPSASQTTMTSKKKCITCVMVDQAPQGQASCTKNIDQLQQSFSIATSHFSHSSTSSFGSFDFSISQTTKKLLSNIFRDPVSDLTWLPLLRGFTYHCADERHCLHFSL